MIVTTSTCNFNLTVDKDRSTTLQALLYAYDAALTLPQTLKQTAEAGPHLVNKWTGGRRGG